jgi:16S rRNA (guanine966-N2)-methyltransferase
MIQVNSLCCRLAYLVVRYTQMRISGGTAKGRPTATLRLLQKMSDGERLRPTSAKVREALFDIIRGRMDGAGFVDLYAGTGTVGLEALSRGAGRAVFVEPDKLRVDTISKIITKFGFEGRAIVIRGDAVEFIAKASAKNERYDIFFIDPPYQSDELEKVMPMIDEKGILSDNGLLIVEHFFKKTLPETFKSLKMVKQYKYGDTMLTLYGKVNI